VQEKLIRDQLDQQVRNTFKSPLIHGIVFGSRFGSGGLIDQELGFFFLGFALLASPGQ
jgi:hypothetical protein